MLEFFYDVGSPWTYLAFHKIEQVAAEAGAELVWKPILVGGVFNAVNPAVYESRANPVKPRAEYMGKDLADWARSYGLAISFPKLFPVNSVKAMRGCFVAEDRGCISAFSRAVFAAYWGDHRDIAQDDVLTDISAGVGDGEVDEVFVRVGWDGVGERHGVAFVRSCWRASVGIASGIQGNRFSSRSRRPRNR